ncbi:MAG: type II secretion system protein GspD, partial [Gammaproteobacteria bacterium]|nr:type II secretion system protein GspD [Gammaproteobacteria bacterium]
REVPFLTGSFSNSGGVVGSVNPFQTIQRQDVGLKLKVTPQINEGNAVIMEIELEVSSVEQGATAAVDLVTSQRNIRQKVVVEDGGIIVLGGLIDETLRESDNRVPGLSRIPIFGNLFKARSTDKEKRNLMVFISPTILRDGEQAYLETDSKYNYIRNLQIGTDGRIPLMPGETRPAMPPLDEFSTRPPSIDQP